MRVLITESKFQKAIQSQVDKILERLKVEVEEDPKQFRPDLRNNIDNVDYINIVDIEKKTPVTQPDGFVFLLRCEVKISSFGKFSTDSIYEQIELELRQIFGRDFFFILVTQKLIKPEQN